MNRFANRICSFALVLLVAAIAGGQGPTEAKPRPKPVKPVDPRKVQRAIDAGAKYLLSQIGKDGVCKSEYAKSNPRFGGKTMLCIYALAAAGVDYHKTPAMKRAIKWAMAAELNGTYAVALRAAALAAIKGDLAHKQLRKDARWLMKAPSSSGAYTYTSAGGTAISEHDNSNAHFATMGVAAAAASGVEIPQTYWKLIERYWLAQQQPDGGWGYCTRMRDGKPFANTYGSMTAAGVATLLACFDQLNQKHIIRCDTVPHHQAHSRAMKWLDSQFSIKQNPRKGQEYYYFWLFSLQRVGLLTGRKYIGGVDWYAAGARQLLRRQRDDGSWGYGDRVERTAFGLLFLARGAAPILVSKVRYPGKWNPRPRDAAHLAGWLSYSYECPLGWSVIDIDSDLAGWDDGRILYLSGAGPVVLTDKQIDRLRRFVMRGGIILSESACNNGDFTVDMHKIYQRLFPRYRLKRLDKNHPVYNLEFKDTAPGGLLGVSNGIRPLAIHAPRDFSLAMELGISKSRRANFNLMANLYLMLTEKGSRPPGIQQDWPDEPKWSDTHKPRATIRLARLKYKGFWNPEPLATEWLAGHLGQTQNIRLIVSKPLAIEALNAKQWPVAQITGAKAFTLSAKQIGVLKKYLADGGTLMVDAAGSNNDFATSWVKIMPQFGQARLIPPNSPIYTKGPYNITKVRYRRQLAKRMLPSERNRPRLQAVYVKGRPTLIFSVEDLAAGIIGYPLLDLAGYHPDDAKRIMTNILCHAAKIKPPAKTKPPAK
ncbi:MAG: DUF4159 domain-containing protein [Phycisphaerae bacterium]|nr:DUF4159 domain-containing protein [Phycisphaerae bacterium]